jgi:hypothetical protein
VNDPLSCLPGASRCFALATMAVDGDSVYENPWTNSAKWVSGRQIYGPSRGACSCKSFASLIGLPFVRPCRSPARPLAVDELSLTSGSEVSPCLDPVGPEYACRMLIVLSVVRCLCRLS